MKRASGQQEASVMGRKNTAMGKSVVRGRVGGWVEALEDRRLLAAPPLCGPSTGSYTPIPVPVPAVQVPQIPPANQPPVVAPPQTPTPPRTPPAGPDLTTILGRYSGTFRAPVGKTGGTFGIRILSGSKGVYNALFSYNGAGRKLLVPARLTIDSAGNFSMKYVSPKAVVQVSGTLDMATGAVTGEFQVWDPATTYKAGFTLAKQA